MAQSTTDSNRRGIPAFWPNHTVEPPAQWNNWIDQFHLAIIAKENLDIDNLKEPLEGETMIPVLEGAQESETDPQRKTREARNKETMRVHEHAEDKRLAEEKRKFGGMRRYEADKKVRPILYLALRAEGKRVFAQKQPRAKVLGILFKEVFELLEAAFIKPTNKRYKLLSRKQKNRESYEQFWGALSDLARSCEIGINAEQEWIRDVFTFNIKNCDLQRRLLSETLNPLDALNQAIIDEKGYYNHLKLTNMTRLDQSKRQEVAAECTKNLII